MFENSRPFYGEAGLAENVPLNPPAHFPMEVDDDSSIRSSEMKVDRAAMAAANRVVRDQLAVDGALRGVGYSQTLDRPVRHNGDGLHPPPPFSATLPRGYPRQEAFPHQPEAYASLLRGARVDQRYEPPADVYRGPGYAAQPQVLPHSRPERFMSEPYGLEDEQRSLGYEDGDYPLGMDYGTARRAGTPSELKNRYLRSRSFDDPLGDEAVSESGGYYWAPLAQQERAGSLASLISSRRAAPILSSAPAEAWRQPELPEVIAMLSYRVDAVRANAAAYLQHLCFKNDKVKSEVRRLKGVPVLVELLEHPKKEVHLAACGALKNIAFGSDAENKKAVRNCDGIPALVRLLRKARDIDVNEVLTGTLWNLSSHDAVKMDIVNQAVPALCDEIVLPHSGWERQADEGLKPRHLEWEGVLTNTAGCLRNISSEKREAREKLRECSGLIDAVVHILQCEVDQKNVNSKLVENCVCLLRNLSFQIHREIPGSDRFLEGETGTTGTSNGDSRKSNCFGGRRGRGRRNADTISTDADFPKRDTPAKGYELLYQPEIVRLYLSLIRECKNPAVLEAAAGAIQNLCAGRWMYGRLIRATVRQEKGLSHIAEKLCHENDRVVKAVSGSLRNLSLDSRNKELIGKHAMCDLVRNLPPASVGDTLRSLSTDTVVSILQTINELIDDNLESCKRLRELQGVEKLVAIIRSGTRPDREVKASSAVLQSLWTHRELRRPLEKDGWKKVDFQPVSTRTTPASNAFDDSTLPLLDKNSGLGDKREMIPMDNMGPDAYSTIDRRDAERMENKPCGPLE